MKTWGNRLSGGITFFRDVTLGFDLFHLALGLQYENSGDRRTYDGRLTLFYWQRLTIFLGPFYLQVVRWR